MRVCASATALLVLSLESACNLVGYAEQSEPSTADDGAILGTGQPREAGAPDAGSLDAGSLDAGRDGQAASLLDANLGAALDARLGDALREGGWWKGLPPDLTCTDGQKCYPVCDPASGACIYDCAAASECQNTCLPQTACEVACDHAETCYMACKEAAQCWLDCQDSRDCEGWCTNGSHCQIDCGNAESCHAMCLAGSSCEVDCGGAADCSAFLCTEEAACLMHCGNDGCAWTCEGKGASCPGNVEVCNRDCP
ncbi:MAG: hypothetical protein JWN48_2263 [Myxococcaceae bacterium]|nr:hypothetical protein [Myxococcaceae bacterium]